jgi:HEPN domain-containing protein
LRTEAEIIDLSDKKYTVAEFLVANGFYDDAYYLGGYAFELRLKAKICKTLVIPDFFDFDNSKSRKLPVAKIKRTDKDNLYKPFKVHDYEQLLILSGLYTEFSEKIITDLVFGADWSVISKWDESLRYSTGTNEADVKSFLQSIKNMIQWLQQYL